MVKIELLTYTFITNYRGGIYCTQVKAENVFKSVFAWTQKIKTEKEEIKYLGDKIIKELEVLSKDQDHKPILLTGLKNIWFATYPTHQGIFSINIVQTDIN